MWVPWIPQDERTGDRTWRLRRGVGHSWCRSGREVWRIPHRTSHHSHSHAGIADTASAQLPELVLSVLQVGHAHLAIRGDGGGEVFFRLLILARPLVDAPEPEVAMRNE